MKTLVLESPGNFRYETRPDPVRRPGEALLRIRRIGICGTDLHAFEGTQPFFDYPRVLGHELAADLLEVEPGTDFEPGERVTFIPYFSCGECVACRSGKPNCCVRIRVCGVHVDGGMGELLSVPTDALLHAEGLGYDELALVEPLAIGAHGVRRAGITPGEYVLVVGAGPIGLGTMAMARIAGARVIALDINEKRLAFCQQALGVDHVVNGAGESNGSVEERLAEITHGDMATVVIDATGSARAITQGFGYMAHGGRYMLIGLQKGPISFSHPEFHKRESTLMSSRNATREDFQWVMGCLKKGDIDPKTFITHSVHFDEVKDQFAGWLDPANGVIKAMVSL